MLELSSRLRPNMPFDAQSTTLCSRSDYLRPARWLPNASFRSLGLRLVSLRRAVSKLRLLRLIENSVVEAASRRFYGLALRLHGGRV